MKLKRRESSHIDVHDLFVEITTPSLLNNREGCVGGKSSVGGHGDWSGGSRPPGNNGREGRSAAPGKEWP